MLPLGVFLLLKLLIFYCKMAIGMLKDEIHTKNEKWGNEEVSEGSASD